MFVTMVSMRAIVMSRVSGKYLALGKCHRSVTNTAYKVGVTYSTYSVSTRYSHWNNTLSARKMNARFSSKLVAVDLAGSM